MLAEPQGIDGGMDFALRGFGIDERLMGQMTCLQIVLDNLDIVEFVRVLGDPRAGPAIQSQQDGPRPIGLAAIALRSQSLKRRLLLLACRNRRFARHGFSSRINKARESRQGSVGQVPRVCFASCRHLCNRSHPS